MAEGTYEYECMRAELLGVEKPEYDEFLKRQKDEQRQDVEDEKIDVENLKEVDVQNDELDGAGSKLEELNNLLCLTQKKINNFKYRCSSVTSYMKSRLGNLSSSASLDGSSVGAKKIKEEEDEAVPASQENVTVKIVASESQRKGDLSKALDSHVDKLDAMLEKADKAQYSMQYQRKQMQSFLN